MADIEGVRSIVDTDLYKLTMQCAVLNSYPDVDCTYAYTNRTPDLKLTRAAYDWLKTQVAKLANLSLTPDERAFLEKSCPYLPTKYLDYLQSFRFRPSEQVELVFTPIEGAGELGDVEIKVAGQWVETILYEIPLLVLVSEAYFRFANTDWDYEGQEERAYAKAQDLLTSGCAFSEFGTRRRRSYHAQDLVLQGLIRAQAEHPSAPGKLTGTSNVHFAHRYGIAPVGTVAHEWFMGIAAITGNYADANEIGLGKWIDTFGEGTLSIALTDTFGTPQFLKCFVRPYAKSNPPKSYAELFAGVRQDSGDPEEFVKLMRTFYDSQGIGRKTIVFSDSLTVELCKQYRAVALKYGFDVSFGVGTYLTNDFVHKTQNAGKKSIPLNIVIKISSANGRPAVKISDNLGKNTGDKEVVRKVKESLGYSERGEVIDEANRWNGDSGRN